MINTKGQQALVVAFLESLPPNLGADSLAAARLEVEQLFLIFVVLKHNSMDRAAMPSFSSPKKPLMSHQFFKKARFVTCSEGEYFDDKN